MTKNTQSIRRAFLQYFKQAEHAIVSSSPVVPHDDPTLLFNNAGMNQFKDVFLGKTSRDYTRAASSQKCIRVGGKHNDLDNVGHTRRHLTFFEMLGNFSFGDYFKKEAIQFAWEVSTQVFGFEPERIWPTVFRDDNEAFDLWTHYVPAERITRFGEKDNFWAMGDTGPCGPCSELLYDRGPDYGSALKPSEDPAGERFLEYWNLVFMQFNRHPDGSMIPLPKPSIDTGAGLERVMSLMMNVDSVYETDVLRNMIAQIERASGVAYDFHDNKLGPAFRVISDHLRCLSFAIADGVQPSNVDRGYVLRKVLRRAVRYGRMIGFEDPFLALILPSLVDTMGSDYPELIKGQHRIAEILTTEEEAFIRTLRRGGAIMNQIVDRAQKLEKKITGEDAFKLKDTYGLPFEEVTLLAKDAGLTVDDKRYLELEQEAKERSRGALKAASQMAGENLFTDYASHHGACQFVGYIQPSAVGNVTALVVNGKFVDQMHEGDEGMVVLSQSPFYAEMGGQVGDTGTLKGDRTLFTVQDCIVPYKGVIGHVGRLEKGALSLNTPLIAEIDTVRREKIETNHTATHLLHWALHHVLGEHVKQAGSVVDEERLRFDFSHHKALTQQEIEQIEDLVNGKIRENQPVRWYEISYEEAQKKGEIKQFFGEKYGSKVRVIDINYSKELCGGTHTKATGCIGLFRIAKESSIAAGIRRIEAVTGENAALLTRQSDETLATCATALKTQPALIVERMNKLLEENKQLAMEIKALKKEKLQGLVHSLVAKVEKINHVPLLSTEVSLDGEEMRTCADEIMLQHPSLVLVLASGSGSKCSLIVRVSDDLVAKGYKAHEIVKSIAPLVEGTGGGKSNAAQAGGKAPHKIQDALQKVKEVFR